MKKPQMTKQSKARAKKLTIAFAVVALFLSGILATVYFQKTISDIKAQGVAEYKLSECDKYSKDGAEWLECDVVKAQ